VRTCNLIKPCGQRQGEMNWATLISCFKKNRVEIYFTAPCYHPKTSAYIQGNKRKCSSSKTEILSQHKTKKELTNSPLCDLFCGSVSCWTISHGTVEC
jgi:hypothetical protein